AAKWLSLGALISIVGILNGWLLVTSRMAHATARDGCAPQIFATLHPRRKTPVVALVVTSLCSGGLVSLYFSGAMLDVYNFIAMLSTATALTAIGCACAAQVVLLRREPEKFRRGQRRRGMCTAILGLLVVILMIAGAGLEVIGWTLACMVVPVPYYLRRLRKT
ncbi:MAG: APC family permease, partial [Nannocystaceae bacterium]